jgi:tetratricopeptide (TPR) repeat protein
MKTVNPDELVDQAVKHFHSRRYGDAAFALFEALPYLRQKGDQWVRVAELYALMGRCDSAMGRYEQAAQAHAHSAAILRELPDFPDGDLSMVSHWFAEATADCVSKEQLLRLFAQMTDLVKNERADEAERLCAKELMLAGRSVRPDDWYLGGIQILRATCLLHKLVLAVRNEQFEVLQDADALFEQVTTLQSSGVAILSSNRLRAYWLLPTLEDLEQYLESTRRLVAGEESDFVPSADWTPEADRSSDKAGSRKRRILYNWSSPFSMVSFSFSRPELAKRLEPADQLFTRKEYEQCLELLETDVQVLAVNCGDPLLATLTLVLAARCHQALGRYEQAEELLNGARHYAKEVQEIGATLMVDVDALLAEVSADHEKQTVVRHVQMQCEDLCAAGKFKEARLHVLMTMETFAAEEGGEDGWLFSALSVVAAANLITCVETGVITAVPTKVDMGGAAGLVTDVPTVKEALEDAQVLLTRAESDIRRYGHQVPWVNAWEVDPLVEKLNGLLAGEGL